jgi:hypothetical protein
MNKRPVEPLSIGDQIAVQGDVPTTESKGSGTMDSNFLRNRLSAAGAEQVNTCTLCGAVINAPFEEAHNQFHQADYEPFATEPGVVAETCKVCGILLNGSYEDEHNRIHMADYEPFQDVPDAAVETCRLCGILTNPQYWDEHQRSHR